MRRSKKHTVKHEPETSSSRPAAEKEHDLAYYIHDRVELMHQVFSVLKPKELKAMAPECVRHISINDLQELCMEELLGISSKRLCAILDGATPPSDTESSSESEQLETISLDSISSDEEILSQISTKKSKKHKHRSKSKSKKRKSRDKVDEDRDQADRSRRAGLTVLELLELQARARAIRAQLQQEQASAAASTGGPSESATGKLSDDEVEIKEEAAEVVEISSEDEKPNVKVLEEQIAVARKETAPETANAKTVTKRVNDLVITVPKINTTRKIKLRRNTNTSKAVKNPGIEKTSTPIVTVEESRTINARIQESLISNEIVSAKSDVSATKSSNSKVDKYETGTKIDLVATKDKNKSKDKKKKRQRGKHNYKDGSDHDEITLQLSDTEKMDLLEDLEGKKSGKCTDTEDSSSDSSSDTDEDSVNIGSYEHKNLKSDDLDSHKTNLGKDIVDIEKHNDTQSNNESVNVEKKKNSDDRQANEKESFKNNAIVDTQAAAKDILKSNDKNDEADLSSMDKSLQISKDEIERKRAKSQPNSSDERDNDVLNKNAVELSCLHDLPVERLDRTLNEKEIIHDVEMKEDHKVVDNEGLSNELRQEVNSKKNTGERNITEKESEKNICPDPAISNAEPMIIDKVSNLDVNKDHLKEKSDGELSDRDSSEVEASDFKLDVVCISDDDDKKEKKKKKKDKKSKKEKKCKKKKNFRESADQNFYCETSKNVPDQPIVLENEVILISEKIYDNSSACNSLISENIKNSLGKEVITVEETERHKSEDIKRNEIESLKLDGTNTDTDSDDVYEILELSDNSSCYEVEEISISKEPTAEEIEALSAKVDELDTVRVIDSETQSSKESEEVENVSWKDRYLNSSKVRKVLTTANILNAMRKKNLELKMKLGESKKKMEIEKHEVESIIPTSNLEDGSIEQYKTLETSTKYVDSVKVVENPDNLTEIVNKITDDKTKTDGKAKSKKDSVTKEMKKEAKQLLKMYKMLLKYNNMFQQEDLSKKKNKKKRKERERERERESKDSEVTTS